MIAYFDCFSGISGDMTLGALLHLGVPVDDLAAALARLPLEGFEIVAEKTSDSGIAAIRAIVKTAPSGHARHLSDIEKIIGQSDLSFNIKEKALAIFRRLGRAEAAVHGIDIEKVHFHEVGAIDAIVDVVGTAFCLDWLKVEKVLCSPLPLGRGFVRCAHGVLPLPAPATVELLAGCPTYGANIEAELVTPTGAAIVSTLAEGFGPPPQMIIKAAGYGAGSRKMPDRPNLLRILLGEACAPLLKDRVIVIESLVDDMNPEHYSLLTERLFEHGALDVALLPAQGKKGRPATLARVVCPAGLRGKVCACLLENSTATGLTWQEADREKLARESVMVETPFGPIAAKLITDPCGRQRIAPEYEACAQVARQKNLPVDLVYSKVLTGRVL
jgi:uncharacterized protein (TIGR00299 family) protein